MEGELGSGARIAIALIVIGVIISVIFVILGFTRGTTNQGITTVSNSMDSMSLAQFDDYDQKIMSGTQVISAIKLFEGRPVGMIVRTLALNSGGTAGRGYNYGAIFKNVSKDATGKVYTTTDALTKKNTTDSFYTRDLDSTEKSPNMQYLPMTESGTSTFVRPTAKFLAELIKDNTGTYVGVAFTQLAN
ncbi:hypothetical protein [Paenibacillus xylaniclasticus]|uniref:hypothetical protein n=1 Tax=Paenibacillus xylaniclasticus TaxID=588083 RepID=UPI000FD9B80D|nr:MULTISPECIES: hypothetical protein [Paenibacillus]GFN30935.1 hypothetical protein PCURB6_11950 [Paenibacillus curdlanolyticus]